MPCQIDRLATEVLDGLRHWPYILDIVERLSSDVIIRDALLRLEPTLLRDIVVQASRPANLHSKYAITAAAMLMHPLPKDVPLPSEIQSIFIRAFEQAAEEPSVQSIKPIYHMLQGTSTMLLGLLSSGVLLRFEEQLFSILRNIKGDNQSFSLYCLAIMKVLSSATEQHMACDSYDTQELLASTHVTPSRWTSDAMNQFFSCTKAQKTMQLVVLRAMWACTTTTGEPMDERIESLRLANEIIMAVPADVREIWRKANALIGRKLEEKVLASALETSLQFLSLSFVLRLTEDHVYPATIMDRLRQMLAKCTMATTSLQDCGIEDISYLTRCRVFDQTTTTTFLQNTVDFATSASAHSDIDSIKALSRLLQSLSEAMSERDEVVEGTMLAIDVLSCGHKLQHLAKLLTASNSFRSSTTQICDRAIQSTTNEFVHTLCRLFLNAALSARHSTYSISRDTMALLLDLYASSSQVSQPCSHTKQRPMNTETSIGFAESTSTPNDPSSNWRESLRSHLESRNSWERTALTTLFTKSCAELEARCETIEQPLQEQKKKFEALQERYDDLQEAYTKLEAQSIDRNIQFNAMEMGRDQYLSNLESAHEESEGLERKVEELERGLQQARTDASNSVAELRKEMESAEFEHASVLSRKEEELDEMHQQLTAASDDLKHKTEESESLQKQLRDMQSLADIRKHEIDSLTSAQDDLQAAHDRLQKENSNLLERQHDREVELERIKQAIDAAQQAHDLEVAKLGKEAEDERTALETSHKQSLATAEERHNNVTTDLRQQLSDLQHEYQQTTDASTAQTKQLQQDLGDRQKKIDKLKAKCEQKDKQIAEANAMRTNLMAAMGISGGTGTSAGSFKQTKLPHRLAAPFDSESQSQDLDTQANPSPPTPTSGDDESQQRNAEISFTSSTDSRSGPTPKRARPRRTIKVASPAKTRLGSAAATRSTRRSVGTGAGTGNGVKRQALLNVSANQVQGRNETFKTPSKGAELAQDGMDESAFDGSELFTGTQGRQMLDLDEGGRAR